jgi:hypothetical protein
LRTISSASSRANDPTPMFWSPMPCTSPRAAPARIALRTQPGPRAMAAARATLSGSWRRAFVPTTEPLRSTASTTAGAGRASRPCRAPVERRRAPEYMPTPIGTRLPRSSRWRSTRPVRHHGDPCAGTDGQGDLFIWVTNRRANRGLVGCQHVGTPAAMPHSRAVRAPSVPAHMPIGRTSGAAAYSQRSGPRREILRRTMF